MRASPRRSEAAAIAGLGEAIDAAKRAAVMAEDERARLVFLPEAKSSLLQRLLGGGLPIGGASTPGFSLNDLIPGGAEIDIASAIPASVWAQPRAVQARLPFAIVWD